MLTPTAPPSSVAPLTPDSKAPTLATMTEQQVPSPPSVVVTPPSSGNRPAWPVDDRSSVSPPPERDVYHKYEYKLHVNDYKKIGDGVAAYYVYKVMFEPSSVPGYEDRTYIVWRRFSDFLGLREKLATKHVSKGRLVPPPPVKSMTNLSRTKFTKEEESSTEFLERREHILHRYMNYTAAHPMLIVDCDFRDFVTTSVELPKSSHTAVLSGASLKKMISKFGDSVRVMNARIDENDVWYEDQLGNIDDMHMVMTQLSSSLEAAVLHRKELAASIDDLGSSVKLLASCEENTWLASAIESLASTQAKIGALESQQADAETYHLLDFVNYELQMMTTCKEIFNERVKLWQDWRHAQFTLAKKRETKARMELLGRLDKIPQAKQEVDDHDKKAQDLEVEFKRMSTVLRSEMKWWDEQRQTNFKKALGAFIESPAAKQLELRECWANYRAGRDEKVSESADK